MTIIPNFILKRLYVPNSLNRDGADATFQILNNLGPGMITRVNHVKVNDRMFSPQELVFEFDGQRLPCQNISEDNPASFFLNQTITCRMLSADLPAGKHDLSIDLVSKEAGRVTLSVSDQL